MSGVDPQRWAVLSPELDRLLDLESTAREAELARLRQPLRSRRAVGVEQLVEQGAQLRPVAGIDGLHSSRIV